MMSNPSAKNRNSSKRRWPAFFKKLNPLHAKPPLSAEELLRRWQSNAMTTLYSAIAVKAVSVFIVKFDFLSGTLLALFFLQELFLLPPLGMALMCVLFFLIPYLVVLLLNLLIESIFLLAVCSVFCYLLSGVVFTFSYTTLMSIQVFSITMPATIAAWIAASVIGAGAAVGYGTKSAIDAAGRAARSHHRRAIGHFLGSLLVLAVIGWPLLSYTQAITGGLAFKPSVLLMQSQLNHFNSGGSEKYQKIFEDERLWAFKNSFYETCIHPNDNIIQGGNNLIAGNERALAILFDGLLYVQDSTARHHYGGAGYRPKETDALVLSGSDAFVFGHDKVFVCGSRGKYTWKDTRWTTEFEKLSPDAQLDRVYDILERQNTTEPTLFSYDEVGIVAYAQRNGLLLDYDGEQHSALFAKKGKAGKVTLYVQTAPGVREEKATFTPDHAGKGIPYTAIRDEGILYLKGSQVMFISPANDWQEFVTYNHPCEDGKHHKFVSLHHADLGENGAYTIYFDDDHRIFTDTRLIGINSVSPADWNNDMTKVSGFAGNYIYSIQYKDDLISRLTYLKDTRELADYTGVEGWSFQQVWMEDWSYQRVGLSPDIF